MKFKQKYDFDSSQKTFQDILLMFSMGLIMIIMIIAMFINNPEKNAEEMSKPAGAVLVEIFWNDDYNIDIDGWVLGPKDERPVGYSAKDGSQFQLLRDDVGFSNDLSNRNFENFFSRTADEGTYRVNVHYWGKRENKFPDTVDVLVTVRYIPGNDKPHQVYSRTVTISITQEINAVTFEIINGNMENVRIDRVVSMAPKRPAQ